MLGKVFAQGGLVWRVLNFVTDVFFLSLLWLLCSVPVITLGASTAALYDSVVRCVRFKQEGTYKRFFSTFKNELKLSLPVTLVWGLITALLIVFVKFFLALSADNSLAKAFTMLYYVALLVPIGTFIWACAVTGRFSFGFGGLNKTALSLCFGKLPRTLVLVLLSAEMLDLCVKYLFPFAFLPVVTMLLWSLFIEPVFEKLGGGLSNNETKGQTP